MGRPAKQPQKPQQKMKCDCPQKKKVPRGPGLLSYLKAKHYWFMLFFILKILSLILLESQGIYPAWLFPDPIKQILVLYLDFIKDPFLPNAWDHPWYLAFGLFEQVCIPFFAYCAYLYYKKMAECDASLIFPYTVYGVNKLAMYIAICFMMKYSSFAPKEQMECFKVAVAYFPGYIFAVALLSQSVPAIFKAKRH